MFRAPFGPSGVRGAVDVSGNWQGRELTHMWELTAFVKASATRLRHLPGEGPIQHARIGFIPPLVSLGDWSHGGRQMLTVLDCRWAELEHCVGGGDAQPVAARNLRADFRLQPALARTADDAAAGLVPAWHSTGFV